MYTAKTPTLKYRQNCQAHMQLWPWSAPGAAEYETLGTEADHSAAVLEQIAPTRSTSPVSVIMRG